MLALRKLNFGLDFPSSKLKQAHGEAACTVLDFLTERACEKCFVWQKPEYPADQDEEAEVDEEADVGDVEDEVEAEMEDEAMFQEPTYGIPVDEDPEYKEAHQILKSGIDPVTWQTELERVLPKLRLATVAGGNEWRAHIEQTKQHGDKISDVLPQTEKQLQAVRLSSRLAALKILVAKKYDARRCETAWRTPVKKSTSRKIISINNLTRKRTIFRHSRKNLRRWKSSTRRVLKMSTS